MTENQKSPYLMVFWLELELALALVIPIIIYWGNTPTSILNSHTIIYFLCCCIQRSFSLTVGSANYENGSLLFLRYKLPAWPHSKIAKYMT